MPLNYHHVSIQYKDETESAPATYGAVVLKKDGKEVGNWATGDPQKDWADYLAYAKENEILVLEASSLTSFVYDVPGWKFIYDDDKNEILVKDDRDYEVDDGPDA